MKRFNTTGLRVPRKHYILGYMGTKGADAGYMLTFDFREPGGRVRKAEWAEFGGRRIFDVIV